MTQIKQAMVDSSQVDSELISALNEAGIEYVCLLYTSDAADE